MKKILMTAAALTLGTSAYAWMPMQDGGTKVAGVDKAGIEWDGDKTATASSDWTSTASQAWDAAKAGNAQMASAEAAVPKAFANWTDPSVSGGSKVATEDGDIQIAENEFKAKDAVDGTAMASADTGAKVATEDGDIQIAENEFKAKDSVDGTAMASADTSGSSGAMASAGMGGPFEAAADYPPCRPGPGDDHCIQLYERGVGQSLAMSKGAESAGMGGPFEPVADDAGKTEGSGTAGDTMSATNPGAVGGPVEQRTGYPPCRPGRGDDSCIQLYERGVARREK